MRTSIVLAACVAGGMRVNLRRMRRMLRFPRRLALRNVFLTELLRIAIVCGTRSLEIGRSNVTASLKKIFNYRFVHEL